MEIIPLVTLRKRKMTKENGSILSIEELKGVVKEDIPIYFYDIDGIEKDKPNLCLYQQASKYNKMWVDTGPRVLGDVVDLVMAGTARITLRKKVWPNLFLSGIKDITENKIYLEIDLEDQIYNEDNSVFLESDGLTVFINKSKVEGNYKLCSYLKNLCLKHNIYVYEPHKKNFTYWEKLGISGILTDLDNI